VRRVTALTLATVVVASLAASATPSTTAATASTVTTTTPTTIPQSTTTMLPPPGVPSATTLACARAEVATWPLVDQADETIAVPVDAAALGPMAPAAREGFGAFLLFGATGPRSMGRMVARLQSLTPHHATMLVMTDEEGGGVARLTNLVNPPPWAQVMGRSLTACVLIGPTGSP
jgi:beta-N-acetylhexosaminidase